MKGDDLPMKGFDSARVRQLNWQHAGSAEVVFEGRHPRDQ
jgi:hypothetical protein